MLHELNNMFALFVLFTFPFFNKISNGFRSFAYAVPFFWNHIRKTVRCAPTYLSLKKNIETFF